MFCEQNNYNSLKCCLIRFERKSRFTKKSFLVLHRDYEKSISYLPCKGQTTKKCLKNPLR